LSVSAGKKKCLESVSAVIPEVVDEEILDAKIAVDDDISTVHKSGVPCAVSTSYVTPEVLAGSVTVSIETVCTVPCKKTRDSLAISAEPLLQMKAFIGCRLAKIAND